IILVSASLSLAVRLPVFAVNSVGANRAIFFAKSGSPLVGDFVWLNIGDTANRRTVRSEMGCRSVVIYFLLMSVNFSLSLVSNKARRETALSPGFAKNQG